MTPHLLSAGSALAVTLLLVPPTIALARSFGLLDAPDAARRLHCSAVPRLGGIAVWLGTFAGVLAAVLVPAILGLPGLATLTGAEQRLAAGLVAGIALMLAAGFVDDVRGLRPAHKLAVQILAAGVLVTAGFRIDSLALPGSASLSLGLMAVPATMLWLVGVTNAFNLIDGLDGLAGGVALVGLVTVGASGVLLGNGTVLALAIPLAAGIVGFLRFNTARPSRIFLGDVGSLSIGFALAALSIEGARRPQGDIVAVVPLFGLAFPLFDTAIAMIRRWLRGVPLSGADGRHVHHQLVCLGLTRKRAAAAICAFSACVALAGLSLAFAPSSFTLTLALLGGAAAVLVIVHGLRWLGYHEFVEAQASFASGLYRARSVIRDRILAREFEVRIRTVGSYGALEVLLAEMQAVFGFESMQLADGRAAVPDEVARAMRGSLRLDRPLRLTAGRGEDFILRVWWREESRTPPLYAERVVRMLAPAIEAVLPTLVRSSEPRAVAMMSPATPVPLRRKAKASAGSPR